VVHFHALIRLDSAESSEGEPVKPTPQEFTAEVLERAVREAARGVAVRCGAVSAEWGDQLDIRRIAAAEGPEDLTAEAVAAYIAKYATKSTEAFGGFDRRLRSADIEHLDLSEHVKRLVRACWVLGGQPAFAALRLRRWAHQLGFGGHLLTKSRRYATTFTALRRARAEHAIRARFHGDPRDAGGRPASVGTAMILAQWRFAGRGYSTPTDANLAAAMAEEARARRQVAREESRRAICA
jgi:hypothetical protein